MKKLLLIGIDSLAPELLVEFQADLPNLTRLRSQSPTMKLASIFPVDSIPAWVSIYTGLNPARHGIVKTFDIFDSDLGEVLNIDTNKFKGRTFWDYASNKGKTVCILSPLLAFPPWQLNGIMTAKSLVERHIVGEDDWIVEREVRSYPESIAKKHKLLTRGVIGKHPGQKNLIKFSEECRKATLAEAEFSLKMCKDDDWDVFFTFFDYLDIVQHRLWRFYDKRDPTYPGPNPFQNIIREFYILLDSIVGQFIALNPKSVAFIFSDHGHGMRPAKTVNINEVLRNNGLLTTKGGKLSPLPRIMEWTKSNILNGSRRLGLDKWLVNTVTSNKGLTSLSKSIYMSTALVDRQKTVAHLSSFAGVKSYSHGGIEIVRQNLGDKDYEKVRDLVINMLKDLKEPQSGEHLIEWACRREELYPGNEVDQAYPDLVFELKRDYGTGWGMNTSLINTSYDHILASGGHKKDAVFLLANSVRTPTRKDMTLMDIAPTVLDILEVTGEWDFDGRSIFKD